MKFATFPLIQRPRIHLLKLQGTKSMPSTETRFELPSRSPRRQGANFSKTILNSQNFRTSTFKKSKNSPTLPVLNDFDFQIVLARRGGAKFVGITVLKADFWEPSKPSNPWKYIAFSTTRPADISHCYPTSMRWELPETFNMVKNPIFSW